MAILATAEPVRADLTLRVITERGLPESLKRANDVRWAGPETALLAVSLTGAVELALDPARNEFQILTPDGHGSQEIWLTSRLGVSESYMAVAGPVFSLGWKPRASSALAGKVDIEDIEDVDVWADRVAVLGLRRGEEQMIAPDGAVAWTGSFALGLADLDPIHFSSAGRGARPFDICANFELGGVRFLPDGSLIVVPGAEPGIYLYSSQGKLLHTWQSEPLGLDALCDFDDAQRDLMSEVPLARWAWINRFRTVDEVLPFPQGPGLVIRYVTESGTRWEIKVLRKGAPALTWKLPITSRSNDARLRGDVRGDRVLILLYDEAAFLEDGVKKKAAERPRLIQLEITE